MLNFKKKSGRNRYSNCVGGLRMSAIKLSHYGYLKNIIVFPIILTGILIFAGCSTPPQVPSIPIPPTTIYQQKTLSTMSTPEPVKDTGDDTATAKSRQEEYQKQKNGSPIHLTPLTKFSNVSDGNGSRFSNAYTRIRITGTMDSEKNNGNGKDTVSESEDLPYNSRYFLTRLFWGSKFDINLSAKIKVGDYEATAPLLSISHQSNRDGELWARSIKHKLLNFPLFLVKEDGESSIPDVRITLAGSKEYTSNMAATALQVSLAAIKQVAPEATVLTKLTEQSSKDTARAIDGAIGKLFTSGINEEHVSDFDLREWNSNKGMQVELKLPFKEKAWDKDLRPVGNWTISFDEPRPSIFSDWRICEKEDQGILCMDERSKTINKVHKAINPGQVLNYSLVKNGNGLGTIRAYITQQDWYLTTLSSLKAEKINEKENIKAVDNLCRNIISAITGLGLNGDDAEIVVWAVIEGLPRANNMSDETYKGAFSCNDAFNNVEKDRSKK